MAFFFALSFYLFYLSSQAPQHVTASDFVQEASTFLDFASETNLDGAGFVCDKESGQCTVSEPSSAGSIGWQLLGRSAIYRGNPSEENKQKIASEFAKLTNLSYSVPFVHGASFYQAYQATKEMRYAVYGYIHTAKQASEIAAQSSVSNYGAMLLGMVGQEFIDMSKLTADSDFRNFYTKTIIEARKQSQRPGLKQKEAEQQLLDMGKLFLQQAVRVRDLLTMIMKTTDETNIHPVQSLPIKKVDQAGNELKNVVKTYKTLNPEWAFARCWSATVNASLFQTTGTEEYQRAALDNLKTLETSDGSLKLLYNDAVAPSAYLPCIEAASILKQKSTDNAAWLDTLIQRLMQSVVINAFDSKARPRCTGESGVLVSWPAELAPNASPDLCSTTSLTIADTSHAIFIASQIQGLFNL
jgi:hypothetical protein